MTPLAGTEIEGPPGRHRRHHVGDGGVRRRRPQAVGCRVTLVPVGGIVARCPVPAVRSVVLLRHGACPRGVFSHCDLTLRRFRRTLVACPTRSLTRAGCRGGRLLRCRREAPAPGLVGPVVGGVDRRPLRVRGRGGAPPQHGGWQPVESPSDDGPQPARVSAVGPGWWAIGSSGCSPPPRISPLREPRPSSPIVVLASAAPAAPDAADLLRRGVHVVSLTSRLESRRPRPARPRPRCRANGVSVVVGAAVSPGLSALLARHLSNAWPLRRAARLRPRHGRSGMRP